MARFTSPDANGLPGPTGPTGPAGADGADGINGENGIGIPEGGTGGQILAKIDDTNYNTEWIDNWAVYSGYTNIVKHEVKAGIALTKGQAVYVSSADGTNMIVSKASNSGEGTSSKTMGLIESSVSLNGKTNVITEGLLAGLNTNGANAGDPVWLGTNGNLIYGLANKPVAPAHLVFIGIVTRVNANNGEIFIRPQNGFEVEELHNVLIGSGYSSTPADNDLLAYDTASGLWKNQTAAEAGLATVSAGSVLKDTMLSNSQLTVVSTTIAQTTSNVNFVTYNYTPVSSSSYLMIDFHLSKYIVPGSMDDSYYSILLVDGNEISYGYQAFNDDGPGTNNRTGVLFPLMGRYTNSSTSAKQIQIAARRGTADDSITIDSGTESTMWLRITEVAR